MISKFSYFQIIEQLYTQDIIMHAQYLDLLKQEAVVSFKVYITAPNLCLLNSLLLRSIKSL